LDDFLDAIVEKILNQDELTAWFAATRQQMQLSDSGL